MSNSTEPLAVSIGLRNLLFVLALMEVIAVVLFFSI